MKGLLGDKFGLLFKIRGRSGLNELFFFNFFSFFFFFFEGSADIEFLFANDDIAIGSC